MQQVNLYTDEMRPRRELLSPSRLAAVTLTALVVVVFCSGYAHWRAGLAAAEHQAAQLRLDQLRSGLAAAIGRLEGRQADPSLSAELERLNLDLHNRSMLIARLEKLATHAEQGFSPLLTGLSRQAVEGVWLTTLEADREPGNVVLKGLTRDGGLVPYYLEQLRSEPAFAGRRFRQFQLERVEDNGRVLGFSVGSAISDSANGAQGQ